MSMYQRPSFSGARKNGGPGDLSPRDAAAKKKLEDIKNTPMKNPITKKEMTPKEKIQRHREMQYEKAVKKGPVTYK